MPLPAQPKYRGPAKTGLSLRTLLLAGAAVAPVATASVWPPAIDASLVDSESSEARPALVLLESVTPDSGAASKGGFEAGVAGAVSALKAHAERTQAPLVAELERRGIPYRQFWVANAIEVKADLATLADLALFADVVRIEPNRTARTTLPDSSPAPTSPKAVEWGVANVRAPDAWALGVRGAGVVVAGQDTGYRWDHAALRTSYRGWNGNSAIHDHHWWDSIHADVGAPNANPCGYNSTAPCDDHGHGTHTMGTIVGLDGANEIGVAPDARWIACRNMDLGDGVPASYLECFQFFLAPTDLAGQDPRPDLAPHVINNSWGCIPAEGCAWNTLASAVSAVRSAGILVVASAGNSGPGCSSVTDPPALYADAFTVGAHSSSNAIAGISSRGPVMVDGSGRLKPDVTAPGVSVRSSLRGGGYGTMTGTSMAGPHVAGVAALVMSANPALKGNPAAVEAILRASAVPTVSALDCGSFAGGQVPNAVFGYGRVDALAAVRLALDGLHVDGFESAGTR